MRWLVAIAVLAGCDKVFGLDGRVEPDAAIPAYVVEVMGDAPVAYYRLGEPAGVTCSDAIGDLDGTYAGAYVLGQPGALVDDPDTSVQFGPEDSGVLFGDVHEFADTAAFSLEAWAHITTQAHFSNLVAKYAEPPTATGYVIYTGYGRLGFARGVTQQMQTLVELDNVAFDGFRHIVGTYDGGTMRLYVDGVLAGEKMSAIVLPDRDVGFTIGTGNGTISSAVAEGLIDEVAVYSAALSPARVYAHYAAGRPPPI